MRAVRVTKNRVNGNYAYVNPDRVLYWYTVKAHDGSRQWTRIVFDGVGDGAALGVEESSEELQKLFA